MCMPTAKRSSKPDRNYGEGVRKTDLVAQLYHIQEPICPLCKQSLLPEVKVWLAWRERKTVNGERVRRKDANINIDHIVPLAEGGSNDISNLALTHRRCNDIRGKVMIYDERPQRSK